MNAFRCLLALLLMVFSACDGRTLPPTSLSEARQDFHTKLLPRPGEEKSPAETPPGKTFALVKYPAASGPLAAYLTPDPGDGQRHSAIVWITGGDCNSIGDVWSPAPRANDQTAAAYRQAGIVMLFPSLRGGNDNPGMKEGFLGEVDDVLAAAKYLASQSYVDSNHIYLGGHSTGGTLALLTAECSPFFRAVFAFGPAGDVAGYGVPNQFVPADLNDDKEDRLRSPGYWLASIQSPTWVLEGTEGNIETLRAMAKLSHNAKARFVEIKGSNHFATLAPTNELIARQILRDTGAACNVTLTAEEVNHNFAAPPPKHGPCGRLLPFQE